MKTKVITLIVSIILTVTFTGCYFNINQLTIVGNGELIEEIRNLPEFDEIVSNGSYNVYYEYADSHQVRIVCESNLMPYVETSVFDKRLDIRSPFHVSISHYLPIDVYIKSPSISRIVLAGSGEIETCTLNEPALEIELDGSGEIYSEFRGNDLDIKVTGSGEIYMDAECQAITYWCNASGDLTIDGFTDLSKYTIIGSGDVNALSFPCAEANINISGSGEVYINVEDRLNVNISGSGDVYYVGNPVINQIITGSGELINKNTNL
ncbi:MAG: DUF2807 domain-containing protein [Prolixibacteraceae bacterium]|nr:DUF2807 domain-containing protein [Prolixibacteraceae bacterium]